MADLVQDAALWDSHLYTYRDFCVGMRLRVHTKRPVRNSWGHEEWPSWYREGVVAAIWTKTPTLPVEERNFAMLLIADEPVKWCPRETGKPIECRVPPPPRDFATVTRSSCEPDTSVRPLDARALRFVV